MAPRTSQRIASGVLAIDRQHLLTLQSLADYSPRNPNYALTALQQQAAALVEAEAAEILALRALVVARQRATAAGIAFHRSMQGAAVEVLVQYGEDSPALHAIGRKQKSERRRPGLRANAPK